MSEAAPTHHVLIVEDDPSHGSLMVRMLAAGGYETSLATSAADARVRAKSRPFELAICDIRLPGEDGLVLIKELRATVADIAIVVASGIGDTDIASTATSLGAYGYLVKPFDQAQLLITVDGALHRRQLELADRAHQRELLVTVEERTKELQEAVSEISLSREETIARLMRALEMRDGDTGAHVVRIGALAEQLAQWAGIEADRAAMIGLAARMHDIGKIGVSDQVLLKAGPLDPDERREIEQHPVIGRKILVGSRSELLRLATTIAATHHERFDGTGYPEGSAGASIPIEGRIAAIVDVFDALHAERCYRPAIPPPKALAIMREGRGSHFDPELFDTFMDHYAEALEMIGLAPSAA